MKTSKLFLFIFICISLTLIFSISVSCSGTVSGDAEWSIGDEKYTGTFSEALAAVSAAGGGKITLLSDVHISGDTEFSGATEIYGNYALYVDFGANVTVPKKSDVTICCNVFLDGLFTNRGSLGFSCTSGITGAGGFDGIITETFHSWGEGTVEKPATVKEAGLMSYTCQDCGETKTEFISKLPGKQKDVFATVIFSSIGIFAAIIITCAVITKVTKQKTIKQS